MRENKDKQPDIFISESRAGSQDRTQAPAQRNAAIRKYAIIGLMALVCAGCLYMIFAPSGKEAEKEAAAGGLNQAVPQAIGSDMPADKGKAYEQEMLQQRNEEKKRAVTTLSDYWEEKEPGDSVHKEPAEAPKPPGLESYRNARASLGSFYQNDEGASLKQELAGLRKQMAEQSARPSGAGIQNQLALMEKSYQMASKYFPGNIQKDSTPQTAGTKEEPFQRVDAASPAVVSSLSPHGTPAVASAAARNSVRACVHKDQTVTPGVSVQLRLLEPAAVAGVTVPSGSLVTAVPKFEAGRLQLVVNSVICQGTIIPVSMAAYDTDGLKGLNIPYNPEANALSQVAGNMASSGGTSIMMTQSAGQQMAADLSRGVVQGISGYFSKKVKIPKVHLPASYELLLVSKK
ncbi:conjugative transposon protein TraM [Flavobacterium sp. WW92]|uniref:conjugative transposon protein TraM n=1 Tax=unclassified Flavobacterium TaxID=196869 RepID=UPI002225915F|nr:MULTISPECIES: conjugative transposon protein TraM [unclassified Flavobacterium]WDO12306.1 conjugative transposon protein TraM [Flavobacterium sp. WW92]